MSDDELREEIGRCDHRAVVYGEVHGDMWSDEAKRLRRILKARGTKQARPGDGT